MKHNLPINYRNYLLIALCCMVILPSMAYAQDDITSLDVEHEQYILERTGEILVKIFGEIELDGRETSRTQVVLTHTTSDGEAETHFVRTNNYGYYEFYFVHDWESSRGMYYINVSNEGTDVGSVSYKLIQDPSYKTDREVKEEFWNKDEDRRELINSVVNAWEYYEGNKKEINYWMKNIFHWYYTHSITEDEVINSIQYLIENEILRYD